MSCVDQGDRGSEDPIADLHRLGQLDNALLHVALYVVHHSLGAHDLGHPEEEETTSVPRVHHVFHLALGEHSGEVVLEALVVLLVTQLPFETFREGDNMSDEGGCEFFVFHPGDCFSDEVVGLGAYGGPGDTRLPPTGVGGIGAED